MMAIAIDGPAGAGKTTLARAVAAELGWHYLDTGAMYRAVALAVIRAGVDPGDGAAVARIANQLAIDATEGMVVVNGEDVTTDVRRPDVTKVSSIVSRNEGVRREMVARQRAAAGEGKVVMEGRDIGTVVLPDACLKIFLTAALDERVRRRANEEQTKDGDLDELKTALAGRDEADRERTMSPLTPAPDAVHIDSSNRTVEGLVDQVVGLVTESCGSEHG